MTSIVVCTCFQVALLFMSCRFGCAFVTPRPQHGLSTTAARSTLATALLPSATDVLRVEVESLNSVGRTVSLPLSEAMADAARSLLANGLFFLFVAVPALFFVLYIVAIEIFLVDILKEVDPELLQEYKDKVEPDEYLWMRPDLLDDLWERLPVGEIVSQILKDEAIEQASSSHRTNDDGSADKPEK